MLIKVSQVTTKLMKHARQHVLWSLEEGVNVRQSGLEAAGGSGTGRQSLQSQEAESFPEDRHVSLPISNQQAVMEGDFRGQLK